jgi:hypothetical protein
VNKELEKSNSKIVDTQIMVTSLLFFANHFTPSVLFTIRGKFFFLEHINIVCHGKTENFQQVKEEFYTQNS